MASTADILLRIRGQDQTGNAFKNVENKASQMKSTISSAVGMAAGMIGYDLVTGLAEAGREAINSSQKLDYYAGRLNMSEQQSETFRNQLKDMQSDFRKVDMTAVGAAAEEIAMKSELPVSALKEVTQMTTVMSSAFVNEGRTQEEAILAVNDALGGQFKRLGELNITQDMLKENGWSGELSDQEGLIRALNDTMGKMGYEQTAKDITTLDDAWQALTVAGGRLLADVVIPLTPAFIAVTDAILGTIDFVKDNGWAQGALLIGGLAVGFGLFAGALSVAAAAEGGLLALMPGFITSLYGAASGFMAITVAGAPLWAIVAAVAAVAVAVYEVGIYFGWWKDVGTMLEAISDGVRRLWEAFINSPQVQGTIKMVQGALQQLWTFIQPMIQWIQTQWNNIFGSAGSNPDAIRMIWQAFQTLGTIAGDVVNTLIRFGTEVYTALSPIIGLVSNIVNIFSQMWNGQVGLEQGVMMILANVSQIYATIGRLVLQIGQRILTGIVNALRPIPGRIWQFLTQAALRLVLFGAIAAVRARLAGQRIINGIISFISQLPARVWSYMMQVPSMISNAAGAAVGAAMGLASGVVSAVQSGIVGIAEHVYTEFMNIPGKINSAVSDAVSAAANFGSGIKDAVLNALHIASPGIIQRKIAIEFADIPGRIGESTGYVYSAAKDYAGNILQGFNAPQMTLSSIGVMRDNNNYTPTNNNGSKLVIINFQEGAVPVDARNMTQREAQGILLTAIESVKDVNI